MSGNMFLWPLLPLSQDSANSVDCQERPKVTDNTLGVIVKPQRYKLKKNERFQDRHVRQIEYISLNPLL